MENPKLQALKDLLHKAFTNAENAVLTAQEEIMKAKSAQEKYFDQYEEEMKNPDAKGVFK